MQKDQTTETHHDILYFNLSQLTFHQKPSRFTAIPRNPGIASKKIYIYIYIYIQTSWLAICKMNFPAVFSWNKSFQTSKNLRSLGFPRTFQGELHSCSTLQDLRCNDVTGLVEEVDSGKPNPTLLGKLTWQTGKKSIFNREYIGSFMAPFLARFLHKAGPILAFGTNYCLFLKLTIGSMYGIFTYIYLYM